MRIGLFLIYLLFLGCFPFMAEAQDIYFQDEETQPIQKLTFFEKCLQESDENRSEEVRQESCACLAAHMHTYKIKEKKAEQPFARNLPVPRGKKVIPDDLKIYTEVYAPCVFIPARESLYKDCFFNTGNIRALQKRNLLENMCHCVANRGSGFLEEYASIRLAALYQRGMDITDPFDVLLKDFEFQREMHQIGKRCLGLHGGQ